MNGNSNTLSDHWSFLNDKFLRHNKNKGSRAIIASNIVFLCIENACGIGLKGIMRFLLFQNAPSSTFQMDLVKFVVLWKWETIWKDRSLNHASIYVCFLVVYSTYAICIAYLYESLKHSVLIKILLTILLRLSIGFTLPFIKQEYRESKAYFRDGKIFEPVDQYWSVRYYLKSVWNVFEIIAYILMVLVLPVFHGFAIFASTYTLPFLCILAFELVLVWTKVWYFAQAFDQTGAFVLLIASVVKDCTVFLTLAVVFLLGFGLFMFVVFQYSLSVLECTENSNEECDDEIRNKIFSSFGNPLKAMLTLFYAMIGTFDPEVYFHSGVVAPFVILMFVAFVSIQMVIMFNMVIAIMNDTYDRVKTNEEQLLLLGKARFIDACEAALDANEIAKIENTSGKYLYVLFPKDDEEIVEDATWRGRIKTMEDKNKSMMNKTKREILNEINSIKKKQDSQYKEIMGRLVQLQKGVKDALELLLQNCQLTSRTRLEEHKGVKEDFTSLNSQVESKNVLPSCSKMTYLDQHVLTENESSADPSFVQELVDNVIFIKDSTTLKVDPVQLMEIPEAIKKDMIKRGTDLDRMFENKETLLGASSTHNAIELTQKLISHGVDIDCKDNDGWSPLHFAAMRNSLDLAKELIDCGAYINSRNSNGATPLHIAVENDSINIAKELISNDAEIDCETNMGYTPFYIAARRDSIDVARELLSSGANKESKGSDGLTPLLIAAKYNSFNVAKELIKSGANIEKQASDGWTALHIATESHSIDIVKELLHNGANVDSKTQARLTPLHCAAIFNAVEIAQELLLYKADVESLTETIETPLHVAAFWNSLSMVKILCENGANIEARTVTNETPLHIAAAKNSIDVAKELIKLGANVNSQTVQGKTPFCIASFNGSSEMMELLLENDADINSV